MSEFNRAGGRRIVDAWMQHPSKKFLAQPMFDSLRRWSHDDLVAGEIPIDATIAAMDTAGVRTGMISLATKYPNLYIDTSAYKISRYPTELVDFLRGHGRKKVMFGSNHPAWPALECLRDIDSLNLDAETEELFLHANATRVFALSQ